MGDLVRLVCGGHYTFPVRYGWITKGLRLIAEDGSFRNRSRNEGVESTADRLGIGSKMVESLAFWLKEMGLADRPEGGKASDGLVFTDLGRVVYERDPYLEMPGTWWFLHMNLATGEGTTVFQWFFNEFDDRNFRRDRIEEAFFEFGRNRAVRPPKMAMIEKDVSCLVQAYSVRPGVDAVDPNDLSASPLRELGLIIRHDSSFGDRFDRARNPVGLPAEAFLASVSNLCAATGKDAMAVREMFSFRNGPGRLFGTSMDLTNDMAARAGTDLVGAGVEYFSMAGERYLRVPQRSAAEWMTDFYNRTGASE